MPYTFYQFRCIYPTFCICWLDQFIPAAAQPRDDLPGLPPPAFIIIKMYVGSSTGAKKYQDSMPRHGSDL